ncbi:hypothetical protein IAT40_003056 [Kwoniella sp. CBS 6097]
MTTTSNSLPQVQLDHVVVLLPLDHLRNPPSWLTDNFTIIPGGKHAGGVTENSLILLQDGVYIELISFSEGTSEEGRAKHFWGKKPYGIIDYAFTISVPSGSDIEAEFDKLRAVWKGAGVDEGLIPSRLAHGGRTRPDGTKIEWRIAFPQSEKSRGTANFWCIDVTSRELRVPLSKETTSHPSEAKGVASLSFRTTGDDDDALSALGKLFGSYLKTVSSDDDNHFTVATPLSARNGGSQLILEQDKGYAGQEDGVKLRLAINTEGGQAKVVKGDIEGSTVELIFI